jgi:SAM-dependent methyltransferase
MSCPHTPEDLKQLYERRLSPAGEYRKRIWAQLCRFFERWIARDDTVLDLGCGNCEFINAVRCGRKYGMDLNPDAAIFANRDVNLLQQDCSEAWAVPEGSLGVVFTSNFFEHLPDKAALGRTLEQVYQALAPGGRLIAMGPNVRYVPGAYWDFFDHYLPLTERALVEVLKLKGFEIDYCRARFLPYTMSHGQRYPVKSLSVYLAIPLAWRFFGKQFLVVASKRRQP